MGMVGEACLPSNAYCPRTPDNLFWGPSLLVWTFWFVIRLRIFEFGLWLRYHDRNYIWCIDWVGSLYANQILCISVLRVASGPRVKLDSCKRVLTPPVVFSADRSKAVVPALVLLFVALWFILWGDLFYVLPCVVLFLCFSVLYSIAITSLSEERANLSAFRTFVWFVLVWFCWFSLPIGFCKGLRFVIVALSGLFSYRFFT